LAPTVNVSVPVRSVGFPAASEIVASSAVLATVAESADADEAARVNAAGAPAIVTDTRHETFPEAYFAGVAPAVVVAQSKKL
jgi:hypothetical protein